MKFILVFIFLHLNTQAWGDSDCILKLSNLENQSYEQILRYANVVRKQACINNVLKSLKQYSDIPQADALESALIHYRCLEGCSEAEEKNMEKLLSSSCAKGFKDVCLNILFDDESIAQSKKLSEAKKYCDQKSSYACFYLGLELQESQKEESLKYKKRACELKSKDACDHLKELERIKKLGDK